MENHNTTRSDLIKPASRRVILYLSFLLLAAALWYLRLTLMPVFLGAFMAYLFSPLVRRIESYGLTTHIAIVAVYLFVGGIMTAAGFYIVPKFIVQLESLTGSLPQYTELVTGFLRQAQDGVYRFPMPETLQTALINVVGRWEVALQEMVEGLVEQFIAILPHAVSLIAVPVLAYYFLLERAKLIKLGRNIVPTRWRAPVLHLTEELDRVLLGFIRSRLLIAGLVGVATAVVFLLLGLPYSLLVGLFAALTDLIPYFGPILGAVPAAAVAATYSSTAVVWVLGAFFLIQQLESYLLSPLVMSDGVQLHPIWVVVALFTGARVGGLLGMILAIPVFACARVVSSFIFECWPELNPIREVNEEYNPHG